MSKAEPEHRPLVDIDPLLADYALALREVDTPAPERADAAWAASEARTQALRPSRMWIPAVLLAAAVIVGFILVGPSSVIRREQASQLMQAPYGSDAPETDGRARSRLLPPTPEPESKSEPEPEPESEPEPEPQPLPLAAVPPRPKAAPAPRAGAQRPKAAKPPSSVERSSLAQETSLLREIQKAQAASDHTRVLELTQDHAGRFPKGTFAAERTLARVRALCGTGSSADAQKTSQDFVVRHPKSHLVSQFESACAP